MYLNTKISSPPPSGGVLPRSRLTAALDRGWQRGCRLFLISAPAGYGKTTLAVEWLASAEIDHAWVSLDKEDNDPVGFCTYLIQSLDRSFNDLGAALLPLMRQPQPPSLEAWVDELINRTKDCPSPLCLVLDDYHLIHVQRIHQMVQRLVEYSAPTLRVMVITREDPPLPLPRLRARQQVTEIRQKDLRFDLDECAQLLQAATSDSLLPEQVQILADRTEGWAAGLHLASLSLQSAQDVQRFLASFSGANVYIIDYLIDEVLSHQPEEVRQFLFQAAVLDRFNADLCDAALARSGSRELLRRIENANLFLIPLDEERKWYRFHHLFADILRGEVGIPVQRAVQRRAALWLQNHNEPEQAVQYAFAAQEFPLAASLIQRVALPALEKGQVERVLTWMDALPETILLTDSALSVYKAWFLLINSRISDGMAWIQKIQSPGGPDFTTSQQGMLIGLTAWGRMASGAAFDLDTLLQAEAMLGEEYNVFRPLLLMVIGQAQRAAGQTAAAQRSFETALHLAEISGQWITALIIANNLAFLLDAEGRRAEAFSIARENLERCLNPDGSPALPAAIPSILLGCLHFGSAEDEDAIFHLNQGLNLSRRLGLYGVLAQPGVHALVMILAGQGRGDEALRLVHSSQRMGRKTGLHAVTAGAEWTEAEMNLQLGNLPPAADWAARILSAPPGPLTQWAGWLQARLWVLMGEHERALAALQQIEIRMQSLGQTNLQCEALVWQARAHARAARPAQSRACIAKAVALAAPGNYRRPFLAPDLRPLLVEVTNTAPDFVRAITAPTVSAPVQKPAPQSALVEQPGERELEILRLVAAGASNQDISKQLYITVGTVKWHLNNLYGKLAVTSRTQAVARAKELGIL